MDDREQNENSAAVAWYATLRLEAKADIDRQIGKLTMMGGVSRERAIDLIYRDRHEQSELGKLL